MHQYFEGFPMTKFALLALIYSFSVFGAGQPLKYDTPQPFWFFEVTYQDGRIMTYPVQMAEFEMALPYGGRVLKAEVPVLINAKHEVKKNLKRRFTATLGSDVLSGEVLCDLSKYKEVAAVGGETSLNFAGGNKSSTPAKIKFFCQF
jgi:hypothetical protein